MSIRLVTMLIAVLVVPVTAAGQGGLNPRERAKPSYESGLEQMRREAFAAAAQSFQTAVTVDPTFEMAHYMLGRAHLAQRNYAAAVQALERSRTLFVAQGTEQFTNKQERQHVFRDRIAHFDQLADEARAAASSPENKQIAPALLEQARQYEERKRQLQDMVRNEDMSSRLAVPGFVSLSLGSAYFRAGKTADAERAYLAAVAADPKIGEAHNNLAVIYMESGRLDDAEKAVKAAEKAGLRVNPALVEEIKKRRKSGSDLLDVDLRSL